MNVTEDREVEVAIAEERQKNQEVVEHRPVVSQDEWVKQRLKLMEKEKQHLRAGMSLPRRYALFPG
jgi:predicted dithiol-disulfide oxidoreductase (DUF899 family)